ncbi:ligase-associated DNA damage response endonuclease PdeM [Aureimonas leprariae]|uniref:Ligase-associated DNA damage response endonuclease PdeM n=1 Tax=Plantimonas leprariae TaxID=2615207 RepID=A0A7V7TWP1_9HYPH|nr:ligase-associated DNA damage response endonuclease PdeM [Aureimonas leprariae]KAB0680025.1 ligase-associated DNA damage response endonuclease PdeM [Aureimonas leprariae]
MNAILRRARQSEAEPHASALNGEAVLCDPSGVLYAPDHALLVVSDLHLEKGAAFARRGMMLPPYDTAATLALFTAAIERYAPARVVCLGDSFHDRHGAALMPAPYRDTLALLMQGREWVWVRGNHDPEPPAGLGGETVEEVRIGGLVFRHEPSADYRFGEVAGHLHPMARVAKNGRSIRGACFASDGSRMIMPSFGITTGGLNVLDAPFAGLFRLETAKAYVIGQTRIYPIGFSSLSR